jgi:glycosyltransferase Alg8
MPFFALFPKAAALTTDEVCDVVGRRIFREWYSMRFAQRQILMSSVGLSRRVLTLTGRMSAFRASVICNPDFIRTVEIDYIDHWRLGRFKFLTGDDKSSWYWILKNGLQMIYVPDVQIRTVEHPPADNFMTATSMLMVRWFGNMLRTNNRAIRLGPAPMGLFTWWCVIDQRISMWTSLLGISATLLTALAGSGLAIPFYLLWIAGTRYVQTLMLLAVRRDVSWYYPFLLFFNQIYGSLLKTYVLFRLDRQKWTRQKTVGQRGLSTWRDRWHRTTSIYLHGLAIGAYLLLIATVLGILPAPHPFHFAF